MKVPLYEPWITKSDRDKILMSLKSSHLTDGPTLRKFESKFSKLTGANYSIGVSNGTITSSPEPIPKLTNER